MKVLFVCTGNTCRSAMCEAYFNSLSRKNGTGEVLLAESAGTDAWEGEESSPFTRTALAPYHTDIADHSARRLTRKMLEESDLIVAMTISHKARILRLLPEAADRVRLLGEFRGGPARDVADPYGGTAEIYTLCFADMKDPLDRMYQDLLKETQRQE
jgi:protein-tyrosine-phosphatase